VDEVTSAASVLELHHSVNCSEQCVVFAPANVVSGLNRSTALSDKYRTTRHKLAIESLYAKPLRLAVTPIPGTAESLFVCHN